VAFKTEASFRQIDNSFGLASDLEFQGKEHVSSVTVTINHNATKNSEFAIL